MKTTETIYQINPCAFIGLSHLTPLRAGLTLALPLSTQIIVYAQIAFYEGQRFLGGALQDRPPSRLGSNKHCPFPYKISIPITEGSQPRLYLRIQYQLYKGRSAPVI